MHRSARRPLSLLVIAAAFGIAAAAPAQAYTPPIGSDKGSVIDPSNGVARAPSAPVAPASNGIIAILIG
jgi:hypothetical protein